MGEILAVRIPPCDDSTYWQTGKLLFSGQCIANGNCIFIGKFSACGGINGHFAFDGDSGFGLFLFTRNAAAADGCAAGKLSIIRSCAALCGDVGGTGFGALDGDRISSFFSGSVNVRLGFCAAADAGCTHTALCIFDGDIALDGHVTSAIDTAADTGTFAAAGGVSDLSVASNDYIADANRAATNAGTTITTLCIFDFGVAFNGHISDSFFINYHLPGISVIMHNALAAADACAAFFTFRIFNDCIPSDDDLAVTKGATADAGTFFAALCVFDDGITFNGHCALTLKAAADAGSTFTALCFFDDGITFNGHCALTLMAAADTSSHLAARRIDGAAADSDSAIAAIAAANTGTIIARSLCGDLTARNGHLTVLSVTAADTGTVGTTRGSQTASSIGRTALCGAIIILFVLNRQRAAVIGLIMFQTGVAISACQRVVAVQLDVRIAAAGHFHGGFVLIGVVAVFVFFINIDVHIIQSDIGRLVFVCFDGDRVPRACARARASDGDVGVLTIFDLSVAVADVFFLVLIIPVPLADELAAFRSVDINGAADNIIRSGKSRKGHAGHHGTGESESCDPLCRNAGRGRCLFLAEKHRNMPQDAHGESAIRDHREYLLLYI